MSRALVCGLLRSGLLLGFLIVVFAGPATACVIPDGDHSVSAAAHAQHHSPDGETQSTTHCPAHLCCAPAGDEFAWPVARALGTTPCASDAADLLPRLSSADLFRPPEAGRA
jgi:hypothetical protein